MKTITSKHAAYVLSEKDEFKSKMEDATEGFSLDKIQMMNEIMELKNILVIKILDQGVKLSLKLTMRNRDGLYQTI